MTPREYWAECLAIAAAAVRALEAKLKDKDAAWMGEKSRAHHWEQDCKRYAAEAISWNKAYLQAVADRDRLAADAERYRWLRAHMTWYVDYEADGDAFVPFHRWYWNASPVVLELDAAIDAARGAGEEPPR